MRQHLHAVAILPFLLLHLLERAFHLVLTAHQLGGLFLFLLQALREAALAGAGGLQQRRHLLQPVVGRPFLFSDLSDAPRQILFRGLEPLPLVLFAAQLFGDDQHLRFDFAKTDPLFLIIATDGLIVLIDLHLLGEMIV
ncbi:MAG: hypothetical protein BWY83_00170 [bacterium ADurb.Bin478]|nr:MAG: hypothetical protein BWY83_00170 [bacterium ADurb.Bin478]